MEVAAKKIISKLFWKLGYTLQSRREVPIQTFSNDPRELPYLSNLPYSVMYLPTELGVGLRFYPLTGKTYHPFILALKDVTEGKSQEEFAYEILKVYSELVTFKSPNDILGLSNEESIFLNNTHPNEYTLPWSQIFPKHYQEGFFKHLRAENKRYGLNSEEYLEGSIVSEEKVKIEIKRLIPLMSSVKSTGYVKQNQAGISGYVLFNEEKWRWYIIDGQHRTAVLAALGYDTIPVNVKQIIRREDVHLWPAVQRKIYTVESALKVFDTFFYRSIPPVANEWVNYVDQKVYNPYVIS